MDNHTYAETPPMLLLVFQPGITSIRRSYGTGNLDGGPKAARWLDTQRREFGTSRRWFLQKAVAMIHIPRPSATEASRFA